MPPPNCAEPLRIPSRFWKIVAAEDSRTLRAAAFIMGQDTAKASPPIDHLTTVHDSVVRQYVSFHNATA